MPRQALIVIPGLAHHVTQWGNNHQDVFFVDDDRLAYLELLRQQCVKYAVRVLGYCLMTNHVHLLATPATEDGLQHAANMGGCPRFRPIPSLETPHTSIVLKTVWRYSQLLDFLCRCAFLRPSTGGAKPHVRLSPSLLCRRICSWDKVFADQADKISTRADRKSAGGRQDVAQLKTRKRTKNPKG